METTLKYRTAGSLPIGRSEYIPKTPEPKTNNNNNFKFKEDSPRKPTEEKKPPPPPPPPKPKKPPVQLPAPPVQLSVSAPPVQLSSPPVQLSAPPVQLPAPEEQNKPKMPPFDPCKAIIETSPYYVYFKIVTKPEAKYPLEEDVRMMLNELVVVDKDMPKTAKYRNFRTYVQ
ncbi:cell division protein ZipA-like [Hyperolius riggenbachi]|uniref:cell division protein ZipA-like n=1 Tax=Hyperolius riggenbachi TaxID=752182 RepID=UPI0035A31BE1